MKCLPYSPKFGSWDPQSLPIVTQAWTVTACTSLCCFQCREILAGPHLKASRLILVKFVVGTRGK